MTQRILAIFALAAMAFGCAHQPAPSDSNPRQPSSLVALEEGQTASLHGCGGDATATLTHDSSGRAIVQVRNVLCASWGVDYQNFAAQKLDQNYYDHTRHEKDIVIPSNITGYVEVAVGSENYIKNYAQYRDKGDTKGDIVRFYVQPRPSVIPMQLYSSRYTNDTALPACGGLVRAQIDRARQVDLIFTNTRCNQMSIVSANYEPTGYSVGLDQSGYGYGGSRTISPKYIAPGTNVMYLRISSGQTSDLIKLVFPASY